MGNMVGLDKPQMKTRRMCIACWITKAINTHSKCVILKAFQRQQFYLNAPLFSLVPVLSVLFRTRRINGR
jgi:hypothetical protein